MVIEAQSGLLPFNSYYLPEKFVQKARKELSETDETRAISLEQLRNLVLSDTSLSCRSTDDFLIIFLRARKYNVSRAFNLVKKFTNFRKKNPQYFVDMNREMMEKLARDRVFGFLPDRCPDGCSVLVIRLNMWNPTEVPIEDIVKTLIVFLYHSIYFPMTQVNGFKIIFDVQSPGIKHLRYCTPYYMLLIYSGMQECFPGRIKEIHIINISFTFKAAWAIISNFLSEKFKSRIVFHKTANGQLKYFPEKMLPVDMGGELKSYNSLAFLENALIPENLARHHIS